MTERYIPLSNRVRGNQGVSLVELLIALAIIGILASIAYPSYDAYVLKTHRIMAKTMLLEILEKQQNYYTRNMTYSSDLSDFGYTLNSGKLVIDNGRYNITAGTCAAPLSTSIATCVLLTATAAGVQAADVNLTINSAGGKTPAGVW